MLYVCVLWDNIPSIDMSCDLVRLLARYNKNNNFSGGDDDGGGPIFNGVSA